MIHIWQQLIDTIFPPSPSLRILRQYKDIPYTKFYEPHYVDKTIALSHYGSPLIKASITAGKFEHNIAALKALGTLLRHHLEEQAHLYAPQHTILVPIPLHPKRAEERGYNQVDIILDAALRQSGYHTYTLLRRNINTSPQSHLKREERLSHLEGAFSYQACNIQWETVSHVLLVDDVTTTGSTLEAGRQVLSRHLPKHVQLHMIAIAH